MIYVVCYDISDDGRRQRVYNLLKDYGAHVQYSVFECDLTHEQLNEMVEKLLHEVDEGEDFLRIYPLCGWCAQSVLIYGRGKLECDEDFYIV